MIHSEENYVFVLVFLGWGGRVKNGILVQLLDYMWVKHTAYFINKHSK